jgi:arsenate reductase
MGKTKVLFLCTGNLARSQMAEAFLRKYGGESFEAHSAGLKTKGLNPYTIQEMEEIGIPLDSHTSKDLRVYLGHVNFGYLITVCDHAEKNYPTTFVGISQRLHLSFEDPAAFEGTHEEKLAKFRQVCDRIQPNFQQWLGKVV